MDVHEKICPDCRCAYRPTALRCTDCDTLLVFPNELEAATSLPPAEEMVPLRIASMMWCRAFSDFLSERGIPHRIDDPPTHGEIAEALRRRSHDHSLAVYILAEDQERAIEADAAFVRVQIPDMPDPGETETGASEEACPACGTPIGAGQNECSDCGLFLGEPE